MSRDVRYVDYTPIVILLAMKDGKLLFQYGGGPPSLPMAPTRSGAVRGDHYRHKADNLASRVSLVAENMQYAGTCLEKDPPTSRAPYIFIVFRCSVSNRKGGEQKYRFEEPSLAYPELDASQLAVLRGYAPNLT